MVSSPYREIQSKEAPHFAIALLIDLAERGEIDPWDVQVIDAIDRCLSELALTAASGYLEADLSQTGQAFLDAAVLVWLKANTLERLEQPEVEAQLPGDEDALELEDWRSPRLPLHLERQIKRRPTAHPPSNRKVTLQELIEQLQLVAATMEKQQTRSRRPLSRANAIARAQMRAALELASQENLSEFVVELERFLTSYQSPQPETPDWLSLEQLLGLWSQFKATASPELIPSANEADLTPTTLTAAQLHDRVGVFWSLLLLSAQSKVELHQEEFYQDLKIRIL
jgi:segregation and condensation protein A